MCGVVGFVDKKMQLSSDTRRSVMEGMLTDIAHRGRDSQRIYEKDGIVIGHNRLSILDLSDSANQPLSTDDNDIVIAYNGEIYNHLQIRTEGVTYKTHSDTETFLYAYAQYGNKVFEILNGMFAVSFYNSTLKKVTLSIDSFGIKPLYYIDTEDWFAWSSESKAFKHLDGIRFTVDQGCLFEYMSFRTLAGSQTLLGGVKKLLPGEIIEYTITNDSISRNAFKHTYADRTNSNPDIENLLKQSVSEQLLSDVPIGLQLSGGVDSSLVSVLAKQFLAQDEVHSFSIGLKNSDWNEFIYSREVADLIDTNHHEIIFDQEDFCRNYPIATYHLDEPVAYPNTVPMLILSREAAKHVKVLLSGEGADELFGGYRRYTKLLSGHPEDSSILNSNSFSKDADILCLLNTQPSPLKDRERIVQDFSRMSPMQKLTNYDLKTFLPSLLLRQDKMGMASTVENRFPYLDAALLNAVVNLPDEKKNDGLAAKIILKDIASKYLPENIVFRKKCGFGLPISEWMRDSNGLGRYLKLLTEPHVEREYLNYSNVRNYIQQHIEERCDNSETIWILLSLELWAKIFIDNIAPDEIWESLRSNA